MNIHSFLPGKEIISAKKTTRMESVDMGGNFCAKDRSG
jgi:hypothetical protein